MGGPGLGEVEAKRTKESVIIRAFGSLRFSDTWNSPSSAGNSRAVSRHEFMRRIADDSRRKVALWSGGRRWAGGAGAERPAELRSCASTSSPGMQSDRTSFDYSSQQLRDAIGGRRGSVRQVDMTTGFRPSRAILELQPFPDGGRASGVSAAQTALAQPALGRPRGA